MLRFSLSPLRLERESVITRSWCACLFRVEAGELLRPIKLAVTRTLVSTANGLLDVIQGLQRETCSSSLREAAKLQKKGTHNKMQKRYPCRQALTQHSRQKNFTCSHRCDTATSAQISPQTTKTKCQTCGTRDHAVSLVSPLVANVPIVS